MQGTRIKICGLTREIDVKLAREYGADALGFVFARSPRQLSAAQAQPLSRAAGTQVTRVGLFMNQSVDTVITTLEEVELDLLQFHGQEDNTFCAQFGMPFIKAVSMNSTDYQRAGQAFPDASGLLLDSHEPGGGGGTGHSFDWNKRLETDLPLWLAGGLNPDNVAEAIRTFKPWAVDVSSGVEEAPGIKSPEKMKNFIKNARQE